MVSLLLAILVKEDIKISLNTGTAFQGFPNSYAGKPGDGDGCQGTGDKRLGWSASQRYVRKNRLEETWDQFQIPHSGIATGIGYSDLQIESKK